MEFNDMAPDQDLTSEQQDIVAKLTDEDRVLIDDRLYSKVSHRWSKVARIVGNLMHELPEKFSEIPDVYYSQRLRTIVDSGKVEFRGSLNHMRYCEVRRANIQRT